MKYTKMWKKKVIAATLSTVTVVTVGATPIMPLVEQPLDKKETISTLEYTEQTTHEAIEVTTAAAVTIVPNAEGIVEVTTWAELQAQLLIGGHIKLLNDIVDPIGNGSWQRELKVPADIDATIDLNGHKIDKNIKELCYDGNIINVYGTLVIDDSSPNQDGELTGAFNENVTYESGAICIFDGGTVTLNAGKITGNKAQNSRLPAYGAAVSVSGNDSKFIMNGGEISGNETEGNSRFPAIGVSDDPGVEIQLLGGQIKDNIGTNGVGAVFTYGGNIVLGGDIVIDNNMDSTTGLERNLSGHKENAISISDTKPLRDGASIGWLQNKDYGYEFLIASGVDVADNLKYFVSDRDDIIIGTIDGNRTRIYSGPERLTDIEPLPKATVMIMEGNHMTKLSGNPSQVVDPNTVIEPIVYEAADGYCFPIAYADSLTELNGLTVTRDSKTQITVAGTPTADVTLTLPDAKQASPLVGSVEITGTPIVGETLTGRYDGIFQGESVYEWRADDVVVGENKSTYTIQPSDAGKRITVTFSSSESTNELVSTATAVVEKQEIDKAMDIINAMPALTLNQADGYEDTESIYSVVSDRTTQALIAGGITGITGNDLTFAGGGFTAPQEGTDMHPDGEDGTYEYFVTISKDDEFRRSDDKVVTITAKPFEGIISAESVEKAKALIEAATYEYTEEEVTTIEEAQAMIVEQINAIPEMAALDIVIEADDIQMGPFIPVDGMMDGYFEFIVEVERNHIIGETTQPIEGKILSVIRKELSTALEAAETAVYPDVAQGANYDTAEKMKTYVETIAKQAVADTGLTGIQVEIEEVDYVPAIAGTAANGEGVDGGYVFGIIVSKNNQQQSSDYLQVIIEATPYDGITDIEAVNQAATLIQDATYTFEEKTTNKEEQVTEALLEQINALPGMAETGIVITTETIDVIDFEAANEGVDGKIIFDVLVEKGAENKVLYDLEGTIQATPVYQVSGTIKDVEGQPVKDVTVSVEVQTATGTVTKQVVTDADGNYVLTAIPKGIYELNMTKEGKTQIATLIVNGDMTKENTFLAGDKQTSVEVEGTDTPETFVDNFEDMFDGTESATDKVEMTLTVKKEDAPVDKTILDAAAVGQNAVGMYFDMELLKTINSGTPTAIQPPNDETLMVTMEVPEGLRNQGPYTVIRVAEGTTRSTHAETVTLPTAYDTASQTITFEADKFATYALTYTDSSIVVNTLTLPDGTTGEYAEGDKVALSAGTKPGYTFEAWTSSNGGTFTDAKNANTTFTMPNGATTIQALWTRDTSTGGGSSSNTSNAVETPFSDIATSDWFYEDVLYVTEKNYMEGLTDKTFGPNFGTSRAVVAEAMWQMAGKPEVEEAQVAYTDVAVDSAYSKAIAWTTEQGIYAGFGDGTFQPDSVITREQLMSVVYRYAKFVGVEVEEDTTLKNFTDGHTTTAYAVPAMEWAVETGLIKGRDATTLAPLETVTRAETAAIIERLCETVIQ